MEIQKKTSCLHASVYSAIDSFTIIRPAVKTTRPTFPPQRKFPSNWIIFLKWKTVIKVSKQRTILVETKESTHAMKNTRFYFVNLTEGKKKDINVNNYNNADNLCILQVSNKASKAMN